MCLAVPVKIVEINKEGATNGSPAGATGEVAGVRREVNTGFLKDLKIGDYVLLHAGFAIQKVDTTEAKKTLKIWEEIEEDAKE
ncbi:MAG: HypC/HybG/HupF family hydrogenase formation chaperone [Elusimicrobia bacterium]|jgi:hydrogenase expression/formation protein HypC|nr:HypC/HybG/HupF family hydrogenase formation chaperone [Elusimicrobiota bacterium]